MELIEYINAGIEKAGTGEKLSAEIGMRPQHLSEVKKGKRPLPDDASLALANYLGLSVWDVMKAAKIAAAKTEEQRNIWRHAACIIGLAIVTNVVTPSPAEAAPMAKSPYAFCILC